MTCHGLVMALLTAGDGLATILRRPCDDLATTLRRPRDGLATAFDGFWIAYITIVLFGFALICRVFVLFAGLLI